MPDAHLWPAFAERLPRLLEAQFAAYRRLAHTETGPDDGPRDVAAWENARKAALAHLQALIRIYDLVQTHVGEARPPVGENEPDIGDLLLEVRQELAGASDDGTEFEQ